MCAQPRVLYMTSHVIVASVFLYRWRFSSLWFACSTEACSTWEETPWMRRSRWASAAWLWGRSPGVSAVASSSSTTTGEWTGLLSAVRKTLGMLPALRSLLRTYFASRAKLYRLWGTIPAWTSWRFVAFYFMIRGSHSAKVVGASWTRSSCHHKNVQL